MGDSLIYRKDIDYVTAFGDTRPMMKTVMDGDTLYLSAEDFRLTTSIDTIYLDSLSVMDSTLTAPIFEIKVLSNDTIDQDSVIRMVWFDTIRVFNAYYDVKIFKSNLQGVCDSLNFNTRDSIFTFYRQPILWSDTSQFSADTIDVLMVNQSLDKMRLKKNGFIVNETGKTFFNQIKGKLITAYFDSQEVRRIFVEGNAEAIYYATDESNAYLGVNQSICSEMEFLLANQAIQTLKFLKEPKSKMIPMTQADHNTLRLEGFKWSVVQRPKSVADILVSSNRVVATKPPETMEKAEKEFKSSKDKGK